MLTLPESRGRRIAKTLVLHNHPLRRTGPSFYYFITILEKGHENRFNLLCSNIGFIFAPRMVNLRKISAGPSCPLREGGHENQAVVQQRDLRQ